MGKEYEVRKPNINIIETIKKIDSVGAELKGIFFQKRYNYDAIPPQEGLWGRLRTNKKIVELTYKERGKSKTDWPDNEGDEVIVSDFERMNRIFNKMGLKARNFQVNLRIEYILNGVKLDIDKWPMVPYLIEIEGTGEDDVIRTRDIIGIKKEEVTTDGIEIIFKRETGKDMNQIPRLVFTNNETLEIVAFLQHYYPNNCASAVEELQLKTKGRGQ